MADDNEGHVSHADILAAVLEGNRDTARAVERIALLEQKVAGVVELYSVGENALRVMGGMRDIAEWSGRIGVRLALLGAIFAGLWHFAVRLLHLGPPPNH